MNLPLELTQWVYSILSKTYRLIFVQFVLEPHTSRYPRRARPSPFALLIALRSDRCVALQKPINLPVDAVGLAMPWSTMDLLFHPN